MEKRGINGWLWIGLIGVFIAGPMLFDSVYRAVWEDRNIWWTPPGMALSLEETRNRFEVAIAGKSLERHLSEGTLLAVDAKGNPYRVVSKDVSARMNNWDRVAASAWSAATISSSCVGLSAAFLMVGVVQWLRGKNRKPEEALS